MFDIIGGSELLIIAVVALLVIGPERLPETLRTLGLWLGRLRRSFIAVKTEIEKEVGMDEVRRQLHNEAVMDEMKRIEAEVHGTVNDVNTVGRDLDRDLNDEQADAAMHPKPTEATEPPEAKPRPRSEAELEAAHARRARRAAED